jgi:hypothetical protein
MYSVLLSEDARIESIAADVGVTVVPESTRVMDHKRGFLGGIMTRLPGVSLF